MKYLSLMLSISVLLLSVMPCCIEDKCMSIRSETVETETTVCANSCNDCPDNSYNCCSPFLHCNTCSGFPEARHYKPLRIVTNLIADYESVYIVRDNLPDFISSIWQPPQI